MIDFGLSRIGDPSYDLGYCLYKLKNQQYLKNNVAISELNKSIIGTYNYKIDLSKNAVMYYYMWNYFDIPWLFKHNRHDLIKNNISTLNKGVMGGFNL